MNRFHVILVLLFIGLGLSAQPGKNQKFAAAGYLGANLSQIHGDTYFGYNKVGLRFGIETQYLWAPKYFLSIGLGYSLEGASPNQEEIDEENGNATALNLSFVEIPLIFNYRLGNKDEVTKKNNHALFRSTTLQAGVKVTRLISQQTVNRGYFGKLIANPNFTEADIEFQDFDFAVIGGATAQLGLNYALFVQHSLSVRGLYAPDDVEAAQQGPYDVYQLRPYSVTVGARVILY